MRRPGGSGAAAWGAALARRGFSGSEPVRMLRERHDATGEDQHADRPEQQRDIVFIIHEAEESNRRASECARCE